MNAKTAEGPASKAPPSLAERVKALEAQVAELEKQAHSEHTIGQETLDQIAAYAVNRINEHLRKALGESSQAG